MNQNLPVLLSSGSQVVAVAVAGCGLRRHPCHRCSRDAACPFLSLLMMFLLHGGCGGGAWRRRRWRFVAVAVALAAVGVGIGIGTGISTAKTYVLPATGRKRVPETSKKRDRRSKKALPSPPSPTPTSCSIPPSWSAATFPGYILTPYTLPSAIFTKLGTTLLQLFFSRGKQKGHIACVCIFSIAAQHEFRIGLNGRGYVLWLDAYDA